jgi:hypothetical protein
MTKHPVPATRTMLCVATLGSAAALILRPEPVTVGVFAVCLLAATVHALRHASKKIDRIVAEELAEQPEPQERSAQQRKAA